MDLQGYNNLLNELEEGTCALILGPEFFLLKNPECAESLRDTIYLNRLHEKSYIPEDGFFNTHKLSDQGQEEKRSILTDIKRYFKDLKVPDFYSQVAELPFYLVISLSPDDLLAKAMTSAQRPYHFLYYKKESGLYMRKIIENENRVEWEQRDISTAETQSDKVILFNFMGLYSDSDSLIFTYDALFDFLYSIFPVENLSQNMRTAISKATSFLFLGFGYDKWYLKIIFFTLEKILGTRKTLKKAIFNYTDKQLPTVQLYQNQFQLNFFKEGTLEFIDTLHRDCAAKGLLKKSSQKPAAVANNGAPAKYKILYFSSNPNSLNPLDFEEEFKKIKTVLQSKLKRDDFILAEWQPAATQKEILLKTALEKPNLVVISMHGSQEKGLLFKDDHGEAAPLSLTEFLKDIKVLTQDPLNKLECIIFSCCHTAEFARQVCQYIPFAIGMKGAIQDEAMPEFNEGFFSSLFDDKNIEQAFHVGKRLVEKNADLEDNAALIEFHSKKP